MKRSPQEIINAVKRLEHNLYTCNPTDCFGNDNTRRIQIMLNVIKFDRSKIWIYSNFLSVSEMLQEEPDNYLWRSAIDAREWLDGLFEIEELLYAEREILKN